MYIRLLCGFISFLISIGTNAQNPGDKWQQYLLPEEAGWSSDKLEEARL